MTGAVARMKPGLARAAVVGVASGLAAAAVMNRFQALWNSVASQLQPQEKGEQEEPSTIKAADRLAVAATGKPVSAAARDQAGEAIHYAFGAFLGGAYGCVALIFPAARRGFGTSYGLAVFAIADELMVPAAGLGPPPQRVPLSTHAYSLMSHIVFGAALEGALRVGVRRGRALAGDR